MWAFIGQGWAGFCWLWPKVLEAPLSSVSLLVPSVVFGFPETSPMSSETHSVPVVAQEPQGYGRQWWRGSGLSYKMREPVALGCDLHKSFLILFCLFVPLAETGRLQGAELGTSLPSSFPPDEAWRAGLVKT